MDDMTRVANEIIDLAKTIDGFYEISICIMAQHGDPDRGTALETHRFSEQAPVVHESI